MNIDGVWCVGLSFVCGFCVGGMVVPRKFLECSVEVRGVSTNGINGLERSVAVFAPVFRKSRAAFIFCRVKRTVGCGEKWL